MRIFFSSCQKAGKCCLGLRQGWRWEGDVPGASFLWLVLLFSILGRREGQASAVLGTGSSPCIPRLPLLPILGRAQLTWCLPGSPKV